MRWYARTEPKPGSAGAAAGSGDALAADLRHDGGAGSHLPDRQGHLGDADRSRASRAVFLRARPLARLARRQCGTAPRRSRTYRRRQPRRARRSPMPRPGFPTSCSRRRGGAAARPRLIRRCSAGARVRARWPVRSSSGGPLGLARQCLLGPAPAAVPVLGHGGSRADRDEPGRRARPGVLHRVGTDRTIEGSSALQVSGHQAWMVRFLMTYPDAAGEDLNWTSGARRRGGRGSRRGRRARRVLRLGAEQSGDRERHRLDRLAAPQLIPMLGDTAHVEDCDRVCRWVYLIKDPVTADTNTQ